MVDEYTAAELRDIVSDVEQPFRALDDKERIWHAVEDGSYNYLAEIPARLSPEGSLISIAQRSATRASEDIQGLLNWPERVKAYMPKEGAQADVQGDAIEAFVAHAIWRNDPQGYHKSRIHWHQTVSRFAATLLHTRGFAPPKPKKGESDKAHTERYDAYERDYWRWELEGVAPSSVAFQDRNQEITLATVRDEMPVIDFMRKYHQAKDGEGPEDLHPLTLFNREFPWLRASDGTSPDRGSEADWSRKKVSRLIVDNLTNICHHVEYSEGGKAEYHQVAESYPNNYGRSMLFVATGIYRPNADLLHRYAPLLESFLQLIKDENLFYSILMTIEANKRWIQQIPENAHPDEMATTDPLDFGAGIPNAREMQDVSNQFGPGAVAIAEYFQREREYISPNPLVVNPSPELVEKSTASAVLYGAEAGQRNYKKAVSSVGAQYQQMGMAMINDYMRGYNKHYVPGSGAKSHNDKELSFRVNGKELVAGRALKQGSVYKYTPASFDHPVRMGDWELEVVPDTMTDGQRAARFEVVYQAYSATPPMATFDECLEARGVDDISKKKVELAADQRYQLTGTVRANLAVMDAIKDIALREERDEQELMMAVAPEMGGPGMAPDGGGAGPAGGGYQMQAPRTGPMEPIAGGLG